MVKILFTCHAEPKKDGDVFYLGDFLKKIKKYGKPISLHLMVGESAGERVAGFFQKHLKLVPENCNLALHVHGHDVKKSAEIYQRVFGQLPDEISFGHWSFEPNYIKTAVKLGFRKDYSYCAAKKKEHFFVRDPFAYYGLKEYPVVCDPKYPVNPFTSPFHLVLFFLIIGRYLFSDKTLHFSFHSFDKLDWRTKFVFGLPVEYVSIRNS